MTQEEIIKGNKLIAEFMGYDFISETSHFRVSQDNYLDSYHHQFHSSWDQLMKVIEKIELIRIPQFAYGLELTIRGKRCVAITNVSSGKDIVNVGFADYNENVFYTKIEGVWLVVVKFIEWYNGTRTNH